MTSEKLRQEGFVRVERDDRLLDVFPNETPEKGVELWEQSDPDTVKIVRIHNRQRQEFTLARTAVEQALREYSKLDLKQLE